MLLGWVMGGMVWRSFFSYTLGVYGLQTAAVRRPFVFLGCLGWTVFFLPVSFALNLDGILFMLLVCSTYWFLLISGPSSSEQFVSLFKKRSAMKLHFPRLLFSFDYFTVSLHVDGLVCFLNYGDKLYYWKVLNLWIWFASFCYVFLRGDFSRKNHEITLKSSKIACRIFS